MILLALADFVNPVSQGQRSKTTQERRARLKGGSFQQN